MEVSDILEAAVCAGKIILESGGETYRTEDTILRICGAFGIPDADCFVTTTGIVASVREPDGNVLSLVRRVSRRTVNLEKISQVNDLSRRVAEKGANLVQMKAELSRIGQSAGRRGLVTCAFAALAAGAFTLLFGGGWRDFLVACVIGLLIRSVGLWQQSIGINDFFVNVTGGAVTSLTALIAVRLGLAPHLDEIIIGSIMLLVPGMAIMNAVRDTIAGDLLAGTARAVEAFLVAVAVAVGSGLVLLLWVNAAGALG